MLLPSKVDQWFAEAVTRAYTPWLTSRCIGISERQRREVDELIQQARRAACLPQVESAQPLLPPYTALLPTGFHLPGAAPATSRFRAAA